jgi:hypothetical protein
LIQARARSAAAAGSADGDDSDNIPPEVKVGCSNAGEHGSYHSAAGSLTAFTACMLANMPAAACICIPCRNQQQL